jgi:muramidase (phage lysozyme)
MVDNNIKAFLDTIAKSEGTYGVGDNGYNVLVGSTPENPLLFNDYSEHPHIYNKEYDSTAAGRYQVIYSTWIDLQKKLNLLDFSPDSQDKAAVQLIRERLAFDDIIAGDFSSAAQKVGNIWASFPDNDYEQRTNSIEQLTAWYTGYGGELTT